MFPLFFSCDPPSVITAVDESPWGNEVVFEVCDSGGGRDGLLGGGGRSGLCEGEEVEGEEEEGEEGEGDG